jgi:hypothetical protein
MEMHAHVPKMGRTVGHWLVEGLFIVISVALGFWVTQVREERQNRELAARVLKGLEAEVRLDSNQRSSGPEADARRLCDFDPRGKFAETAGDVQKALRPIRVTASEAIRNSSAPRSHGQQWIGLSTGTARVFDAARSNEVVG